MKKLSVNFRNRFIKNLVVSLTPTGAIPVRLSAC